MFKKLSNKCTEKCLAKRAVKSVPKTAGQNLMSKSVQK